MIQFVAAAAVGAVGLYAYKELRRHLDELKAKEEKEELEKKAAQEKPVTLRKDPKTGRYRAED